MNNRITYKVIFEIETDIDKERHADYVKDILIHMFDKTFRSMEQVRVIPVEEKKE